MANDLAATVFTIGIVALVVGVYLCLRAGLKYQEALEKEKAVESLRDRVQQWHDELVAYHTQATREEAKAEAKA